MRNAVYWNREKEDDMGWLRNFIFGTDPAYDDAGLPKQVRDWEEAKNSDMAEPDRKSVV